jgi:cell division protein ZapE
MPGEQFGGIYLVGPVGRGKSMLMDLFFAAAEVVRKRRIHFVAFMQDVHQRLHTQRRSAANGADPIPTLADAIAAETALLCFDEFQVNDVADALLLGRLFEALFARGVIVVATSNVLPDDLFRGEPGRDAFLPFIAVLRRHLEVLVVNGAQDYRRRRLRDLQRWLVPADQAADDALSADFAALTEGIPAAPATLRLMGRILRVPLAANGVARFDFDDLCGKPLGPGDYLALATHFHTLVLGRVPRFAPEDFDEARRFMTLIDTLYDHRVKLVASAEAAIDELYPAGRGAWAFARTASRLAEMQSRAWLDLPHLT